MGVRRKSSVQKVLQLVLWVLCLDGLKVERKGKVREEDENLYVKSLVVCGHCRQENIVRGCAFYFAERGGKFVGGIEPRSGGRKPSHDVTRHNSFIGL